MDKLLWTIMVYIGFVGRTVVVASGGQSVLTYGEPTLHRHRRALSILTGLGSALLRGNAAKRLLLRGSIPIGRVGQASGYMKPGGVKRMQEDFLSVRPTGVSEGEYETIGFVGDRIISCGTYGDQHRLQLTRRNLDDSPLKESKTDVIFYHDNVDKPRFKR